jgi:threonine efflux protein
VEYNGPSMEFGYLLASLFVVDLLAAISPGPNFVLVSHTAASSSRRDAFAAVVGVITANLAWAVAVVLGLTAIFIVVPSLYAAIKVLGGIYLIYLAIGLWRSRPDARSERGAAQGTATGTCALRAYVRGLLTAATNPKSVVYFGSVFAVFLSPGTPAWVQLAAVAIAIANGLLWYGLVAALFSIGAVQARYLAVRRPLNRLAGVLLGAFGARLVLVPD